MGSDKLDCGEGGRRCQAREQLLAAQLQTYPQVLIAYEISRAGGAIGRIPGTKIRDSRPPKLYSLSGAFRVRVRDLVLLYVQLRSLRIPAQSLKSLERDVASSLLLNSVKHTLVWPDRRSARLLLGWQVRCLNNRRIDWLILASAVAAMPGQLVACFWPSGGTLAHRMVFAVLGKSEAFASLVIGTRGEVLLREKGDSGEYPDYDATPSEH